MKKIIPVISVLIILVFMFTIPAAAASDGWYSVPGSFSVDAYRADFWHEYNEMLLLSGVQNGASFSWQLDSYTTGSQSRCYLAVPITDIFPVQSGDTVRIPFVSTYTGWFGGSGNRMQCRLSVIACDKKGVPLREDDDPSDTWYGDIVEIASPLQLSEATSIVKEGGNEWTYTPPDLDYRMLINWDYSRVFLLFVIEFNTTATITFSVNQKPLTISYGNPNSPEVPSYTPPSGEDSFTDLDGAEQELAGQNQEGLDVAGAIIGDFTLQQFASGLTALVSIYNVLLPRLGWLNALISVSLALGIVSFLLNLVPSIAGKLSGSSRSNSRKPFKGQNEFKKGG